MHPHLHNTTTMNYGVHGFSAKLLDYVVPGTLPLKNKTPSKTFSALFFTFKVQNNTCALSTSYHSEL